MTAKNLKELKELYNYMDPAFDLAFHFGRVAGIMDSAVWIEDAFDCVDAAQWLRAKADKLEKQG